MASITAKCTGCGADMELDDAKDTHRCGSCGASFRIERTTVITQNISIVDDNGINVTRENNLIIHGYERKIWENPDVYVYINGTHVGTVGLNGTLELNTDGGCQMEFKFKAKQTSQTIKYEYRTDVKEIKLLWNSLGMLKVKTIR